MIGTEGGEIDKLENIGVLLVVRLAAHGDDAPHIRGGQQVVAVLFNDVPVDHRVALVRGHAEVGQGEQRLLFLHVKIYFYLGEEPRGAVVVEHIHQHVVPLLLLGNGLFDVFGNLPRVNDAVPVREPHHQPVPDKGGQALIGEKLGVLGGLAHAHVAEAGTEALVKGHVILYHHISLSSHIGRHSRRCGGCE